MLHFLSELNSVNQDKSKSSMVIRDTPYLTIDVFLNVVLKKKLPLIYLGLESI